MLHGASSIPQSKSLFKVSRQFGLDDQEPSVFPVPTRTSGSWIQELQAFTHTANAKSSMHSGGFASLDLAEPVPQNNLAGIGDKVRPF